MSLINDRLTERTVKLIKRGRRIVLKSPNGWYLHCWTNIAAGWDKAHWGKREVALEIFDLRWAFAIAPLYKCKVVSVGRPGKKIESDEEIRARASSLGGLLADKLNQSTKTKCRQP